MPSRPPYHVCPPRRDGSRTARSTHPSSRPFSPSVAAGVLPHPLSSRRNPAPVKTGGGDPSPLPTCHSERSAAESKNLVAIAPSPSRLPPLVRAVREPPVHPQPLIPPILPLRSGRRPPPPVVLADAGTHPSLPTCHSQPVGSLTPSLSSPS